MTNNRERISVGGDQGAVGLVGPVHLGSGTQAVCGNRGDLCLVTREEFKQAAPGGRCGTCERLAGLQAGYNEYLPLSEIQKSLLAAIRKKTNGAGDRWCSLKLWDRNKPKVTSLYRSLRRLERRGFVEVRKTQGNRIEVRAVPGR